LQPDATPLNPDAPVTNIFIMILFINSPKLNNSRETDVAKSAFVVAKKQLSYSHHEPLYNL